MTDAFKARVVGLMVLPDGEPLHCDRSTRVEITDEAAGEFVVITQSTDSSSGRIEIEPDEWPVLRAAIDRMIRECRTAAGRS